jgi:hypothetical protein
MTALLAVFRIFIEDMRRQAKCKHERGIKENQACHAMCVQCGKDLGFIGRWRKEQEGEA